MLARAVICTLLISGMLICCGAATVSARQVFWIGAVLNGDWLDPAEWSTGEVPGPGDTVYIVTEGPYTVHLDFPVETVTVAGLVIGGGSLFHGLSIEGGTLAVDGQITIANPICFIELLEATLDSPEIVSNGGVIRVVESTINAPIDNTFQLAVMASGGSSQLNGSLQVQASSIFEIASVCTVADGGFTNYGTVHLNSGADLYLENGPVFTNGAQGKVSGLGSLNTTGFPVVTYGEVSPGSSTGTLTFNSDITFASDAVLTIEIDQFAFPKSDRLDVSGNVEIQSATLNIDQLDYPTPALSDTLIIITGQSVVGMFSNVSGLSLAGDIHLAVKYDPTSVMLVVEPGCCVDISGNCDGDAEELVDIGDLTALISYLYISPNPVPACPEEANIDGDGEGLIDIGDLTALISYLYIPPNLEPVGCE